MITLTTLPSLLATVDSVLLCVVPSLLLFTLSMGDFVGFECGGMQGHLAPSIDRVAIFDAHGDGSVRGITVTGLLTTLVGVATATAHFAHEPHANQLAGPGERRSRVVIVAQVVVAANGGTEGIIVKSALRLEPGWRCLVDCIVLRAVNGNKAVGFSIANSFLICLIGFGTMLKRSNCGQ